MAGAPAPVELLGWWATLGVDVRSVYGLVESTGVATMGPAGGGRPDTVGRGVPGTEVTIDAADPSHEVRIRGDVVFAGYLDDPTATAEALDGGWLRTGDVGALEADGTLSIVGRIKDVVITSGGHTVAPGPIERRLGLSPYVRAAVVVGDERPSLGALVAIDEAAVGDWAADEGVPFTTTRTLVARPEVRDLIGRAIDE